MKELIDKIERKIKKNGCITPFMSDVLNIELPQKVSRSIINRLHNEGSINHNNGMYIYDHVVDLE